MVVVRGTFVIDTPKDKELNARQRCFRYQEAHRGVVRSKLKPFPEIPKRCGMKNLPIVQLKDLNAKVNDSTTVPSRRTTPEEGQGRSTSPSSADSAISQSDGRSEKLRRQETLVKIASQDELVSRSPLGRIVHNAAESPSNSGLFHGFGVRRTRSVIPSKQFYVHTTGKREFTNLSTNVSLAELEPSACKATERELESQAEYRKQLTFYLSQMFDGEQQQEQQQLQLQQQKQTRVIGVSGVDDSDDGEGREGKSNGGDIHVGHTSKHQEWESSISLGEMLINTTPDLRKRLKLDHMAKTPGGSGGGGGGSLILSANGTPEMTKQNNIAAGKYLFVRRCSNSADCKLGQSSETHLNASKSHDTSNRNGSNYDHCQLSGDKLKSSDLKSPLLPKRRPPAAGCQSSHTTKRPDDHSCDERRRRRRIGGGGGERGRGGEGGGCSKLDAGNMNTVTSLAAEDDDEKEDEEQEEEVEDDEEEEDEGEDEDDYNGTQDNMVDDKWLHMVNTPVVESGTYDRYANVKLPPSWLQHNALNKRNAPVKTSFNNNASTNSRGGMNGACALASGIGTTSYSVNSSKDVVLPERKCTGRVK